MTAKPTAADGYPPGQVARVRATCLYLATKLGDLMPEMVVVGGLVPALLIDQQNLPENVTPYVGTMDLDLGLSFALVDEARYLRDDFRDTESVGPRRAALFLYGRPDPETQADAVGFVRRLLEDCRMPAREGSG